MQDLLTTRPFDRADPHDWAQHTSLSPVTHDAPFLRVALLDTADIVPSTVSQMMATLDAGERRRTDQLKSQSLRTDFVAAHYLLRQLLNWSFDVPASKWHFGADDAGKPHIISPAPYRTIALSLSHTQGFVAAAIARGCRTGIDVERRNEHRAHFDIAERFFCPCEANYVSNAAPGNTLAAFTALWTSKEAFIKAIGKGFAQPLNSFSFSETAPIRVTFHDSRLGDAALWRFTTSVRGDVHISLAQDRRSRQEPFVPVDAIWLRGNTPPKANDTNLSQKNVAYDIAVEGNEFWSTSRLGGYT